MAGMMRGLAAWTTIVAISVSSASAFAEPTAAEKETARALMKDGRTKRESGDHKGALESFTAADNIMRVPTTGLEVGREQQELGLLVEARDTFLRVSRIPEQPGEPGPFKEARTQAAELATSLESRIPSLKIVLVGVSAGVAVTLTLDGTNVPPAMVNVPRKLNPGAHRVIAVGKGVKRTVDVEVKEGETKEITVDLAGAGTDEPEPAAPAPSGPKKPEAPPPAGTSPLVYVGFGVAGVGLVVGSVTGLLAMSKTNTAKEQCEGTRCPPATHDDLAGARTMSTVSTVSFIAAAVGAGVGIYGLFGSGTAEPPKTAIGPIRQLQPTVGLGTLGFSGAF